MASVKNNRNCNPDLEEYSVSAESQPAAEHPPTS